MGMAQINGRGVLGYVYQNGAKLDDGAAQGRGVADVFDSAGHLTRRFIFLEKISTHRRKSSSFFTCPSAERNYAHFHAPAKNRTKWRTRHVKSHPGFERHREAKSISRMLVASVVIAVATSAWGCSSRVESFDDRDSSLYAPFRYLPGNISDTLASVAYVDMGDDSAVARSGYTDPRWEPAELRSEGAGEAFFPATNNRVLEIPQALNWDNTAAAIPIRREGD